MQEIMRLLEASPQMESYLPRFIASILSFVSSEPKAILSRAAIGRTDPFP